MSKLFIRKTINKSFNAFMLLSSLCVILVFGLILFDIFKKGMPGITLTLFTSAPDLASDHGGGVLNALAGSLIIIALSSLISIPFGVLLGLFIAEEKNNIMAKLANKSIDILLGIPSIVIGIVAFLFLVLPFKTYSSLAASFALFLIMLPLISKSTKEAIHLIPNDIREAGYALGLGYFQVLFKVLIPYAKNSIVSGIILGIARISGETAPLLFTAFGSPFLTFNLLKPIDALPLVIYNYAQSPYDSLQQIAWSSSLVLVSFIFMLSLISKYFFTQDYD